MIAVVPGEGLCAADPAAPCAVSPVRTATPALRSEVERRNASLAAARVQGDIHRLMAHYAQDSVFMPEHQPRLFGIERGAAYYHALAERLPAQALGFTTADIVPLDGGGLEWGTFRIVHAAAAGADRTLDGNYVHFWRRQSDGTLKLAAEAWGYQRRLERPAAYWFAHLDGGAHSQAPADAGLAAELAALNRATAHSVQTHSTARIEAYAPDAVYLPFADMPKVGLAAIRAHLLPYIEQGRGAMFERVDVGNDGFTIVDGHVLEYSTFAVHWRVGQRTGITSGGGLRLWRREADCTLRILRQIGTHDYRPE